MNRRKGERRRNLWLGAARRWTTGNKSKKQSTLLYQGQVHASAGRWTRLKARRIAIIPAPPVHPSPAPTSSYARQRRRRRHPSRRGGSVRRAPAPRLTFPRDAPARNPPPLLHTPSSRTVEEHPPRLLLQLPTMNTGSPTMTQKSAITSGHHANTPGLCSLDEMHAHGPAREAVGRHPRHVGRHDTHIPMTTKTLMASSTFIPPGIGHCSVCLCESRRRDRVSSRVDILSPERTRDIFS